MKFSIEHALSCPKGAIRHNEIKDLTANLLTEVYNDVSIELEPIDGEVFIAASSYSQDGARLDIAANGFWGGQFERTFFDVRVFNPHAPSNRHPRCYRKYELEKKRHYEHTSFTPLVLSATGGMANEATAFYKRLASHLANKWDQPYSTTMSWLRCRLTFSLLRSAIHAVYQLGVLAPVVDMQPNFRLHQWTWSYLNLILSSFLCFQTLLVFLFFHDYFPSVGSFLTYIFVSFLVCLYTALCCFIIYILSIRRIKLWGATY